MLPQSHSGDALLPQLPLETYAFRFCFSHNPSTCPPAGLSTFPELRRTHPYVFLKVFPHETLIGEIHLIGNLLDAHRAVFQHDAQFTCDVRVNPFAGCTPADGTYRFREVFRCNAQVLGIPADTAFRTVILLNSLDEIAEDDLGTHLAFVTCLLEAVDDITHVDDQSLEHRHHQFAAESVTGVYDFLTDVQDVAFQGLCLVSVEMEDGMCTGEEEEGRQLVDAADNILEEVIRQDERNPPAVA